MIWTKNTPLVQQGKENNEVWVRTENSSATEFPVALYLGKKMDMTTLKKGIIDTIHQQNTFYKKSRTELYAGKDMEEVTHCMITGISATDCQPVANIYGAEFIQSPDTGHVFVKRRPTENAIHDFYTRNSSYASTYTDKASSEVRLQSIGVPWCDWMVRVYERQYGRKPRKVLDVGAGGGHFVEACRRVGIQAEGVELSDDSRAFSKQTWGIELDGRDFTDVYKEYSGFDVVTFWGLLEHTPNPIDIATCARKVVESSDSGGMVLSKLPRWNSLSAAAQRLNTDTIIRHIDPAGHIMLFSDASAAELYVRSGIKPTAAWYFGMDAYETFMQLSNYTNEYEAFLKSGKLQMELQQFIDENRFSDNIALVGIPNKNEL
jgi:2-polyprenyl-3-methyl-5-hydroxy-6-metoxy-1,4-benzoquinol methylase